MYEGLDTIVLHDELAIEDELPCAWQPFALPLPPTQQWQLDETNLRVLQTCMALEEQPTSDKAEDQTQASELARLDLKLNLLLDLVGRLVAQQSARPVARRVRFNARGAAWLLSVPAPSLSEAGVFSVHLHPCILEPLRLSGRICRIEHELVEAKFEAPAELVVNLLHKLIFRRHRRRIADARGLRKA